jgi:hypothetical protein
MDFAKCKRRLRTLTLLTGVRVLYWLVGFRHCCVFVIVVVFYGVFRLAVRCFTVLFSC